MPVRVFSNEDGNLNSKSVIVSRTKQNADIDLSFSAKFIGLDSDGSNLRADVFKKTNAAAVKQAVRNLFAEVYGDGKEQKEDHDFNRMLSGMISVIERNGLIGALKHEVVAVPVIRELELEQIEMNALKARMAEKKKKIQQMRDGK